MELEGIIIRLFFLAFLIAGIMYVKRRKPKTVWKLISVKGDFTTEHHLPEVLPVPTLHTARVTGGEFSFDEAIEWMRQFVQAQPKHSLVAEFDLALRKADYYRKLTDEMGRGRWGKVDAIAAQLAEIDPLDPSAALARGRAMRQMGKLTSAVTFYQQALKLQPTHSLALPEFAATCRALGQPGRAHDALNIAKRELGETHPLTIESRVQLGELVRVFADPTDPATIAHIPRGQYVQNVQSRLEELEPDLDNAVPLGRSMLNDDMPELAEMVLERCQQSFGDRSELILLQGMIRHYHRDLSAADALFRRALEDDDSPLARVELARVLQEEARASKEPLHRHRLRQEAQEHLRLAIDRDPNLLDALVLLVEPTHEKTLSSAVGILQPIIKAYPNAWGPWRVLGDVYIAEEQFEEAIKAYEAGLAHQQSDALLLPYLMLLGQLKQGTKLIRVAREIENLNHRDPMLRWRVAQAFCEVRRPKEARGVLLGLVDDEEAAPQLRQRAREVLQQLESFGGKME